MRIMIADAGGAGLERGEPMRRRWILRSGGAVERWSGEMPELMHENHDRGRGRSRLGKRRAEATHLDLSGSRATPPARLGYSSLPRPSTPTYQARSLHHSTAPSLHHSAAPDCAWGHSQPGKRRTDAAHSEFRGGPAMPAGHLRYSSLPRPSTPAYQVPALHHSTTPSRHRSTAEP